MTRLVVASLLLLSCSWAAAADPLDDLPPSFQKYIPSLANAVHAVGEGRVDQCLDALRIEMNPASRTPEEVAKFREAFQKTLAPVAAMKLKFESYDIIAVSQVSSQSYTVYGVANGKRGPVHWDFDLFHYEGQWHMHSTHFTVNWKRERLIPERSMYFEKPLTLRLDQREVAASERTAPVKVK